jgi:hypothetical protein
MTPLDVNSQHLLTDKITSKPSSLHVLYKAATTLGANPVNKKSLLVGQSTPAMNLLN